MIKFCRQVLHVFHGKKKYTIRTRTVGRIDILLSFIMSMVGSRQLVLPDIWDIFTGRVIYEKGTKRSF